MKNVQDDLKKIRRSDFALFIVSSEYLKSMERMIEIMTFKKEENYKNRMLLISTNVNLDYRSIPDFINYWKIEKENLILKIQNISIEESGELAPIARLQTEFKNNIVPIMSELSQFTNILNEELAKNNYSTIIQHIELAKPFS